MDEIKHKFRDFLDKHQNRNMKIPSMGFTDNYTKKKLSSSSSTATTTAAARQAANEAIKRKSHANEVQSTADLLNICGDVDDDVVDANRRQSLLIPDQEILDSTEPIYFEENVDTNTYELNKFIDGDMDEESVQRAMLVLKQQHKVISKKVLQNILEKRNSCNDESKSIQEADTMLQQSLLECKKARSYLSCARKNLTTTNLQILAMYKKREAMQEILRTLYKLKKLKSTEIQLQKLLDTHNYSGAIALLLECKRLAKENSQYVCVAALAQKLQDTLLMTELQLDTVLAQIPHSFDVKTYSNLQDAYRLLDKSVTAIDQLHMHFISAIHTMAFTVLKEFVERGADEKQKCLFEEMCENISSERFIPCLIKLCKSFWCILVCYYQVALWHHSTKPPRSITQETADAEIEQNSYIQQKFKCGYSRIWNDIQSKLSVFLSTSPTLHTLKYEQFIQVLSIVQRLRKVGMEFCNEPSTLLMESMKSQSIQFFHRYHKSSLDEIRLFLDNEAWMPVHAFSNLIQLQEFNAVKNSLQRFLRRDHTSSRADTRESSLDPVSMGMRLSPTKKLPERKKSYENHLADENLSNHSQEDCNSSLYGSCGYFLRFSEKSSPFDGGFDATMLEEDILAGIADESCYFSEESEEDQLNEPTVVDTDISSAVQEDTDAAIAVQSNNMTVNNSTLNVLRCIGRYLQMCKLLRSISPQIVKCMMELIEFYIYVVHELFASDLPLTSENLYTTNLREHLNRIAGEIVPKVNNWRTDLSIIQSDLNDPDTSYGLLSRIVGVESAITLVQQFHSIRNYLQHLLLPNADQSLLSTFFDEVNASLLDLRKPIYMCVAARVTDLDGILTAMSKIKWDINHVNVEHSTYINNINRSLQVFSMRLEEIEKTLPVPKEPIWDSVAHVVSHTLVEGYSNAKKCSAGGRALMQLDFAHFMSFLELLSGLKFLSHHRYVDNYIKAYYMPKDLLETYIIEEKAKRTYSTKQLTALITCTCSNDKKTRQKLIALLEQDGNLSINVSMDLNDSRLSTDGLN